MTNTCSQCGANLSANSKSCESCGFLVGSKKEKKLKFILNPSQRVILQKKVLPTLILGSFFWLLGDFFFKLVFSGWILNQTFYTIYVLSMIGLIVLFVLLFYMARENRIRESLLISFLFGFLAGVVGVPIHLMNEFVSLRVHMFVFSSFEALIIVGLISLILKDKYFSESYFGPHVVLYVLLLILAETIFIILFNIQNFILTIPILTANILVISLTIMFYTAKMTKLGENEPWMLIVFKILAIFLVVIVIFLIYAIIILVIIIIAILLDSDIDIPHVGFLNIFYWHSGSRKKRKERREENGI